MQEPSAHGLAPVLGFGDGMGWMAKTGLMLDEMDDVAEMARNIAWYSYDKNMDYVHEKRGIDWRQYLWLIPEGTRLGPEGKWWYRIGDLTNGANQGPAMHALEMVAGVDDTDPNAPRLMPRVPPNIDGLAVRSFPLLLPRSADGLLERAKISFDHRPDSRFSLRSDKPLANLAIRLGPYPAARGLPDLPGAVEWVTSGSHSGEPACWAWVKLRENVSNLSLRLAKDH